jgi:hypothetical protein
MRRTIKLTNRQAEMVLAMFVGNEKVEHYTNEEIRELVTLIWEWQWGGSRSLLKAIGSPHEPTYLAPEAAGTVADRQDTGGKALFICDGSARCMNDMSLDASRGADRVGSLWERGGRPPQRLPAMLQRLSNFESVNLMKFMSVSTFQCRHPSTRPRKAQRDWSLS